LLKSVKWDELISSYLQAVDRLLVAENQSILEGFVTISNSIPLSDIALRDLRTLSL